MSGFCDVILINGVFHDHFIHRCSITTVGQLCSVNKATLRFMLSERTWEIVYRTHMQRIPHTDLSLTWLESFKTNHTIIRQFATRFATQFCMTYYHLTITRKLIRVIHTAIRESIATHQTWKVLNVMFGVIFKRVINVARFETREICFNKQFRSWGGIHGRSYNMWDLMKELFETFGFSVDNVERWGIHKLFYPKKNTRL